MKILLDTNVILDVLLNRQPFVLNAQRVWQACEEGRIDGYVAATSITNIHYLARKIGGIVDAEAAVQACLNTFQICTVDRRILEAAMSLPGNDYEDNVQAACAAVTGLDAIVTRDKQGFKNANILILPPADLLQKL